MRVESGPSYPPVVARPFRDEGVPEDGDLVRRVAISEEDAFRTLVHRYGSAAHALALKILRERALAEDATQEAFLVVWRDAGGYDASRGSVRSWLMGIVHHRAVDRIRREQSQSNLAALSRHAVPMVDVEEEVVRAIDLPGETRMVRSALERLPREQRRVIALMYFGGLSQSQISAVLGIPLGTTKSRCLLGMKKLRTDLLPAGS